MTTQEWTGRVVQGPQLWVVTRDGKPMAVALSENDAYARLQRLQGQSAEWAMRHEGWAIEKVQPWSDEEYKHHSATARQCLTVHDHPLSDRSPLTRENCGACILGGYVPRGGWGDDTIQEPNYSSWARIYVEARRRIEPKWHAAFMDALLHYDNLAYSHALARSIVSYGWPFNLVVSGE